MFSHQDFDLKLNKYMSNFHPLEVVCRGSETQFQVGENDLIMCRIWIKNMPI